MSGLRARVLVGLRRFRRASAHPRPHARRSSLAERIATLADDLAAVIDDAAELRLMAPTPVTNAVLDLRAWSTRVLDDSTNRPTAVDATRLLAYVRTLADRQLLALLADLPWPRLDVLLDAINEPPTSERLVVHPGRSNGRQYPPHGPA
jgi:hypothetical protein